MQRILFLSPSGSLGGAENALLYLLRAIREAFPDVESHLLVADDGPLVTAACDLGVPTTALPLPGRIAVLGEHGLSHRGSWRARLTLGHGLLRGSAEGWRYVRKLRGSIERIGPDLIHSNGIKTHLLARLTGVRIPIVWHLHDFLHDRPLTRLLLCRATRGVRAGLAVSQAVVDDVRATFGRLGLQVMHNAVDVDRFRPAPADGSALDRLADIRPGASGVLRIGLVATYARWKGHDVFLAAAARLAQARPDLRLRFYIVGGSIYRTRASQFTEDELRGMVTKFGLSDCVSLIPFQKDTADIYRMLDVVVHASTKPEPFGLTIVEAMACARPVIVSAAGGALELFRDGVDAIGFPPGNAEQLSERLALLADNPILRDKLGRAGRQTALDRFSLDRFVADVRRIFAALLPCAKPQLEHDEARTGTLMMGLAGGSSGMKSV